MRWIGGITGLTGRATNATCPYDMSASLAVSTIECPPTNKETDWHLAQILYNQGVPLKEVCERCNVLLATLQKRITREGWVERKEQAKAIVSIRLTEDRNSQTVTVQTQETKSNELSSTLLQRMRSRLDYITEGWDSGKKQKPIKTDSERIKALSLLNQAADIGKTLFGWGQSTGSVAIDLTFLHKAEVVAAPVVDKGPVIDVPQVTDATTIVTSRD